MLLKGKFLTLMYGDKKLALSEVGSAEPLTSSQSRGLTSCDVEIMLLATFLAGAGDPHEQKREPGE